MRSVLAALPTDGEDHASPRPGFDSDGYWLYAGGHAIVHLSTQRSHEPVRGPVDPTRPTTYDHTAFFGTDHQVMAAFHTQPLELPPLRTQIRETFTAGGYPQMILRLGYAPSIRALPRRPANDVLVAGGIKSVGVPG